MLRDSLRRFLADRAPIATYVRDAYEGDGVGRDDPVWRGLAELGVLGLLVPEEHGGAGGGMVDAAVALEELGRAVNPAPFTSSAVGAVSLVLAAGEEREHRFLLPGLADGTTIGTLALYEPETRYAWSTPATTARRDGDGWRIDGTKVHVADGATATLLLVTARDDAGDVGVFAVQAGPDAADGAVVVEPMATVDGSRKVARATLTGAAGWRLGAGDATRRGGADPRPPRRGIRRRRCRRGRARPRARRGVRQGAGAVRPADRRVPSHPAPVLGHAAHRRARPRGRATTRAGPPTTRPPKRPTAPRRSPPRSRARPSRSSAAPRSRCSAASGSRGNTTSTSSTSDSSRCRSPSAPPTTTSPSSPPSSSTPDHRRADVPPRPHDRTPPRATPPRNVIRIDFVAVAAGFRHQKRFRARHMERPGIVAATSSRLPPHQLDHVEEGTRMSNGSALTRLSPICRRQLGLFTRVEANSVGVSDDAIRRLVASGLVERISPRVFRVASAAKSWHQDVLAACLDGGPECVASHRTAAALHGFDGFALGGIIEVLVPMEKRHRRADVIVHHTRGLPAEDRTTQGAIPVDDDRAHTERPGCCRSGRHRRRSARRRRASVGAGTQSRSLAAIAP